MDLTLLILVFVLFAVLVTAIVLPIIALVISIKTRDRIAALEAALAGRPVVVEPTPSPEPVIHPPPPRPAPPPKSFNAFELESLIGRRGVGWVAVVLILFATAFFLK